MKRALKVIACILMACLVVLEPVHTGNVNYLPSLTGSLIAACAGSVSEDSAADKVNLISGVHDEKIRKTISATADSDIKYSSLTAVDPLNNPTSLEDFTLISVPGTVSTSGGELRYLKKVRIQATAYCSCYTCCGPYDGTRTADGSRPREYYTIATSKFFSFGTMVYIPYFDSAPNHGVFEVEDRGGAIQNNRIDVYFSSHEKALRFGRRNLEMYILM